MNEVFGHPHGMAATHWKQTRRMITAPGRGPPEAFCGETEGVASEHIPSGRANGAGFTRLENAEAIRINTFSVRASRNRAGGSEKGSSVSRNVPQCEAMESCESTSRWMLTAS